MDLTLHRKCSRMDPDDIRVFIDKLNIQLNMFSFDYMATIAMPFSDLARTNIVSDKAFRSLNIPVRFRGRMLKELLKSVGIASHANKRGSTKRKDASSSSDECSAKRMKNVQGDSIETDYCQTDAVTIIEKDQKEVEVKTSENEDKKSGSTKRIDTSSSSDECSAKRMKNVQGDSIETDYCQTDEVTIIEKDQKEVEVKTSENEDEIHFEDEELRDAIHHLNEFLEKENLKKLRLVLSNSRDEGELEVGLGIHLLSKLAGKAFTSTKKSLRSCPCGCPEKLQSTEKMWIGSQNTWYGELDIITGNPAVGTTVSVSFDPETEMQGKNEGLSEQSEDEDVVNPEDDGENESPGDRTNVEVKYCRAGSTGIRTKLNQVVAQAVVFAFTEYNRHKTKGKCIPSIMMDKSGFQFVIYNPLDDILLVSNYMMFIDDASFDLASGYGPFVLLWIILNHRIFFSKHPDFQTHCVKSGFHEKWSDMDHFQHLVDYSKSITIDRSLFFPDDTPNIMTDEGFYYFFKRKTTA